MLTPKVSLEENGSLPLRLEAFSERGFKFLDFLVDVIRRADSWLVVADWQDEHVITGQATFRQG